MDDFGRIVEQLAEAMPAEIAHHAVAVPQMFGARLFNERAGYPGGRLFGVVTTGEAWQFLRLDGPTVTLHPSRLFIDDLGAILAAFRSVLVPAAA